MILLLGELCCHVTNQDDFQFSEVMIYVSSWILNRWLLNDSLNVAHRCVELVHACLMPPAKSHCKASETAVPELVSKSSG